LKFLIESLIIKTLQSVALECSINRYYDPTTDEFLSIDPLVRFTHQPYIFTNDDPINATDPSGLIPSAGANGTNATRRSIGNAYQSIEAEEAIRSGVLELGAIASTITKAENAISSDLAAESMLTNGGEAPPSFLVNEIKQAYQTLASNLASQGQYLASVASAAYTYLAGKQGTSDLVNEAQRLENIADDAVGTSDEISTALAANNGWALAGDSAAADVFNLQDLIGSAIDLDL
jgi:hypothetical protein